MQNRTHRMQIKSKARNAEATRYIDIEARDEIEARGKIYAILISENKKINDFYIDLTSYPTGE